MVGSGVQLPFLPLWLHAKGLSVSQIASVVAGMMPVRILGAPIFAFAADHTGNRRMVIQFCAVIALVAYMILPFTNGFAQILGVGSIIGWIGIERLLVVGLCRGIIRWLGTAFVSNEFLMLGLQMMHGVSFACAHLALMHFIRAHVPPNLRNTAQGLYAALAGGALWRCRLFQPSVF